MIFALQLVDGLIKGGAAKTILFVGAEAHAGFMPWEDWDIVEGKRVGEPTPRLARAPTSIVRSPCSSATAPVR